jgi:inhibitor of cysteine peptidase
MERPRRLRGPLTIGLALVALASLLSACGPGGGAPIELTASDSGSIVQAKVGDQIVISLEANPTTGYSWQLQSGLDDAVVSFVKEEYQQGATASGLVGAGGTDRIEFKAVGAGTTTISLAYVQAGSATQGDTFEVEVEVS